MKRYSVEGDGLPDYHTEESRDGEWVRYEDHAADRAALVAQLEAANGLLLQWLGWVTGKVNRRMLVGGTRTHLAGQPTPRRDAALVAQVAELTRERNEARAIAKTAEREQIQYRDECSRLAEALAAAEKRAKQHFETAQDWEARQDAVERRAGAQVAELTRERDRLLIESDRRLSRIGDLVAEVTNLTRERDEAERACEAAVAGNALATQRAREAEARVRELEAEREQSTARASDVLMALESCEARVKELEGVVTNECSLRVQATDAALALESECAALRAEVERKEQERAKLAQHWRAAEGAEALAQTARFAAESRLAAVQAWLAAQPATAQDLFEKARREADRSRSTQAPGQPTALQRSIEAAEREVPEWRRDAAAEDFPVSAHATAPTRTEAEPNAHRRGCVCVRCEAEQRVLDAMAAVKIVHCCGVPMISDAREADLCRAELARREASRG